MTRWRKDTSFGDFMLSFHDGIRVGSAIIGPWMSLECPVHGRFRSASLPRGLRQIEAWAQLHYERRHS